MKGVLHWLICLARRAGRRNFCPALAALVSLVQNIFSHHTLFYFIFPRQPAAGQAVVPHRLSLIMCLWLKQ